MKTVEIIFHKRNNVLKDAFDIVIDLCYAYQKNGQLLGDNWPIAEDENSIRVFANIPEPDSLDIKYSNKYVKQNIEKLAIVGLELPEIRLLGTEPEGGKTCKCEDSSFYYLETDLLSPKESPLHCGDCQQRVPLYRLPHTSSHNNYEDILRWQDEYVIYDTLHIFSGVGERLGYKQLVKIDSELSQNGIDICKQISSLAGKPTYYYLYKYYGKSNKTEMDRKCPSCGGEWLLDEPFANWIDFKCDKCLLLSNIGFDVRER